MLKQKNNPSSTMNNQGNKVAQNGNEFSRKQTKDMEHIT